MIHSSVTWFTNNAPATVNFRVKLTSTSTSMNYYTGFGGGAYSFTQLNNMIHVVVWTSVFAVAADTYRLTIEWLRNLATNGKPEVNGDTYFSISGAEQTG